MVEFGGLAVFLQGLGEVTLPFDQGAQQLVGDAHIGCGIDGGARQGQCVRDLATPYEGA